MNPALAYHGYLGPALFVPMARVTLAAAKPKLGERVLDVACGTGIVTHELAKAVGGTGRVVGLDINPGMLAVAAEQPKPEGAAIEWKEGSAVAMDVPPAAFDLVTCQQGLQFFPDRAAGAREMRRVLDANGRAIVACWHGLEKQTFFRTLIEVEARHLGIPVEKAAVPFSFGDANALHQVLLDGGFTSVEIETRTIEARFPEPEKFVRITIGAAAAVMPDFANIDQEALVAAVVRDCADEIARYRDGEYLRFSLPTNLAIARV